jgi:hypothetical protein
MFIVKTVNNQQPIGIIERIFEGVKSSIKMLELLMNIYLLAQSAPAKATSDPSKPCRYTASDNGVSSKPTEHKQGQKEAV